MSAIHRPLRLHTTYSNVSFSHNARLHRRTGVRRLHTATRASALARDLSPEGALSKRSAPKPTDWTANVRGAENCKSAALCRFSCSQAAAIFLGTQSRRAQHKLFLLDRRREPPVKSAASLMRAPDLSRAFKRKLGKIKLAEPSFPMIFRKTQPSNCIERSG